MSTTGKTGVKVYMVIRIGERCQKKAAEGLRLDLAMLNELSV